MCWSREAAPCWTRPAVPAACSCRAPAWWSGTTKTRPRSSPSTGLKKNATTIRRAKMNLAVHGLEGDIQRAISYYEDSHELLGKAGYVMANPRVGSSILPPATIRSVAYRSKHTCQKFLCVNFA